MACRLISFSQYHITNTMVYELIKKAWERVVKEFQCSIAVEPTVVSKRLNKLLLWCWNDLVNRMKNRKLKDSSLLIPEDRAWYLLAIRFLTL
jgi:hypothetical protein